ncbi:hypothetical protein RB614_00610 [Phytohabitans sp. ZYX-F-186]|uniref:Uncharacterized protein n=1 Tax=Phytohabitans maris TaxID=3071409 RepID=A0ABU0Z9L4_9ACTN|nr:hypothetical protein [Phytohabitans sp. ZYX-F-186]MDQ7903020.1 hypothetical protein [Phytohabitans sp. ZYX-F-186]
MSRRTVAGFLVALTAASLLFVVDPGADPARGAAEDGGGGGGNGGSSVTVHGTKQGFEDFTGLAVTVSKTRNLTNEAITVTWTGARPSPLGYPGTDFLSLMQCWGSPEAKDFRETCAYGMDLDVPERPGGAVAIDAGRRRVADTPYAAGYPAPDPDESPEKTGLAAGAKMVPFKTVTGERSRDGSPGQPFGTKPNPSGGPDLEETDVDVMTRYLAKETTNEYPYALTAADGTGRVTFEVQNDRLAPHLGCGAPYQAPDGQQKPRPCYLVIVPRGYHHPYTGVDVTNDSNPAVSGSPFKPVVWQHRMVVPLEFAPVEGGCSLDKAERRTAGAEAVAEAVTSWQPVLCANDGPIYGYSAISDFEAAQQVVSASESAPGLVYSADPVVSSNPPVVHAPVTLSSTVIAVNIDYNIILPNHVSGPPTPPEIERLRGLALTDLKLTPRLLAKVLTQSYTRDDITDKERDQTAGNPESIRYDEEFLTLNPVFRHWPRERAVTLDGLMVSVGSSVAAREVWQWILGDAEARTWIQGKNPDENGMWVNPVYKDMFSTAPDTFPKADPDCHEEERFEPIQGANVTFPLCTLDKWPYMGSMNEAALQTLRAQTKGKDLPLRPVPNTTDNTPCCRYSDLPRKFPGSRFVMSVTDSASAARYGLFTAQLCKPKRDSLGKLVMPDDCRTPTDEAVNAAAATAVGSQVEGVKVVDPVKAWATQGAYPLTTVSYAIADTSEPVEARREYAKLLRYAAGSGQDPGEAWGQLPEGYVPLPAALREQTMIAASQLENWVTPTSPPADNSGGPDPGAAPAPTDGVPSGGATPSAGTPAPGPPPSAAPAAQSQSTLGSPLGIIRFILIAALVMGLLGGIAGPIMQRFAIRSGRK